MEEELKKIIAYADEIAGNWNGDEAGLAEDRAMYALELIENCKKSIRILRILNK